MSEVGTSGLSTILNWCLLNADGGPGGVGATVTPEVAGDVLAPGAAVTAEFVIGLQGQERFSFLVNLFGEQLR